MVSVTLLSWKVGHQDDIWKSSCERDFISIGIGWYLQEFTLEVYEMDNLVGLLREGLDMVPHYHDSLLIDGMRRDFGTYTWQGSEWSKGRFMLDMMAWDPGIERFLHDRTIQRSRTIQWCIWDPNIFFSDNGDQQLESILVQALLEDNKFFVGRTVISILLIFYLTLLTNFIGEVLSIAKFCNLSIGYIFGTWDSGEIKNFNVSGIWGAPLGGKIDFVESRLKYLGEGTTRKGEATITNRGLKATLDTF